MTRSIVKIREARVGDERGIAEVHVLSWQTTYKNIMPQEYLHQLSVEKRTEMWRNILSMLPEENKIEQKIFVALNNEEQIIGFVDVGVSRSPELPYESELHAIYVLKKFHGKGIGQNLFKIGTDWLRQNNFKSMFLWSLKANSAKQFYERMGGVICSAKQFEIGGVTLEKIAFGWDQLFSTEFN